MKNKYTKRQQLFVEHYLTCLNASEAARRAGYKRKANVAGSDLLSNPEIRLRIHEELKKVTVSADEAVARISAIAKGSMEYFITFNNEGKPCVDLKKAKENHKLFLIKKIRISNDGEMTVELLDSIKAMELIIKHSGIFDKFSGNGVPEDSPLTRIKKFVEEQSAKAKLKKLKHKKNNLPAEQSGVPEH